MTDKVSEFLLYKPHAGSKSSRLIESFRDTRQDTRSGEVISAEVVRLDHSFVIVNAGLKSEAFIPIEEFKNDNGELEVNVGDFISVAIESLENGFGDTILSRDKAKRLASWLSLEKAMESGKLVTGTVNGKVKGGLSVLTNGIRAFLPDSLVDTRPVKDTTPFEGKTLEFKVIKLDRKRNSVVLSRRAVIEASMGEERQKLMETLKEGTVVTGIVKNITDYGAFVDLGGIDGLLHITDLAWRHVRHPSEVLSVGQEITAKVLKYDQEKNRVSLGVKQLGDDPWTGLSRRYPQGTRLFGKVTNLTDYGAFVEVEQGIEGLVHVSEMDWTNKNVAPNKVVQLGDEVEVMVLEIDEERRRISLGMKQCKPNPWDDFAMTHKKGDRVSGAIKSITDFGVFIGLPGNIDGLVHLSDLSWTESGEEAVRRFKKGDDLEAVVLAIDVERERVSLGVRQLIAKAPKATVRITRDSIVPTELQALLSQSGSRYADHVRTAGIEVALKIDPCLTLDDFVDRLSSIPLARCKIDWASKADDAHIDPNIGILGIFSSGAIRSIGRVSEISEQGVCIEIDDSFALLDPDANQSETAYTKVVESNVTLIGVGIK